MSLYDERRAWISNFTGSAGDAVVTLNEAALWTDSRYYIQADKELDPKFWKLMKACMFKNNLKLFIKFYF